MKEFVHWSEQQCKQNPDHPVPSGKSQSAQKFILTISKGWKEYSITDGHYCEGEASPDFVYRGKIFRITLCGDLCDFPEKFKTTGILLWPVYVNFSLDEWIKYESEYADQAYWAADKTLLNLTDFIYRRMMLVGLLFYGVWVLHIKCGYTCCACCRI